MPFLAFLTTLTFPEFSQTIVRRHRRYRNRRTQLLLPSLDSPRALSRARSCANTSWKSRALCTRCELYTSCGHNVCCALCATCKRSIFCVLCTRCECTLCLYVGVALKDTHKHRRRRNIMYNTPSARTYCLHIVCFVCVFGFCFVHT